MNQRAEKVLKYFRQDKEYMEQRIHDGIERYRKGDIKIKIVDKNGTPVDNAVIKAELVNHEFNFGANIFMLDTLIDYKNEPEKCEIRFKEGMDLGVLSDYRERNEKYKEYFKELYNFATLPFYWSGLEPEEGVLRYDKNEPHIHRRPTPASCIEFCKENNIRVKAHCLNYDAFSPKWVQALETSEEVKTALDRHFKECAERFAEDVPEWEVTNETLVLYPQPNGETKFLKEEDFVSWSFDKARQYFKNNKLIINDNHETVWEQFIGYRSAYYMQIKQELEKGTPIDAIGLQCHIFYKRDEEEKMAAKFYNPRFLYDVLDRYSDFGLPMQITEITVPTYSDDPEDEAIQAEIMKNLYSIWFSIEKMDAIVYWNLVEGYFEPVGDMDASENYYRGGLVRFDFSKKPSYEAIYNLIHKEWHTCEQIELNGSDEAEFRGFYGDYKVDVTVNGKSISRILHAGKDSDNCFVIEM